MNIFGDKFSVELFGESHTPELGVVIRGIPSEMPLDEDMFSADLLRRKSGAKGTTARREEDIPLIEDRRNMDGSVVLTFRNANIRPVDYADFNAIPRPGHADFTSRIKYGEAHTGGGIFSGRMTLPLVAAGVIAKKMISPIIVSCRLTEIGSVPVEDADAVEAALDAAAREGDSLGAIAECCCDNVPAGLGEPFFDSVESLIAHAVFSIPGIRGIEFGDGFSASRMKGSQHNDVFVDAKGHTRTNGAGGINGGITNGNQILFRVAIKPTSSIFRPQETFDFKTGELTTLRVKGRHDVCFALRVPPVIEAMTATVIANLIV